uniref:Uncharacterized protein n=1 Tax=Magallana gigas TaxID=29159 RepID=K1RWU0_MAGGI
MSTRKLVSVSVTRNGVTTKIPCTQEVADMLMSKEIASDEDDEDFDVFEKIPDMKPKAVLESGTGTSQKRPAADDSSSEETEPLPVKKRVHPKRSAEILQVMLKDLMEKREDKAEQRHQEKLATANSLIELKADSCYHMAFTC